MRRVLTAKHEKLITKKYLELSTIELAKKCKCPKGTVVSALRRMGLKIPKELANQRKAVSRNARHQQLHAKRQPGDKVLKANYLTTGDKTLAKMIGRSAAYVIKRREMLGLVLTPEQIAQRKLEFRFQAGHAPMNKGKKQTEFMTPEQIENTKATRFKKGQLPHNTKVDGQIVIRHDHPERDGGVRNKWIRLSKGKWERLQVVEWEKVHGKIPKGFVLACLSDDTLNCDPANWKLMTREDNMLRNSGSIRLTDGVVATYITGKNGSPELKQEILKNPELIETKRLQLQIKRKIKSIQNGEESN